MIGLMTGLMQGYKPSRLSSFVLLIALVLLVGCRGLFPIETPSKSPPMRVSHVIIISVDGLRPDAIQGAYAPQLKRIIDKGIYFPQAQTVSPPVTLPAHVSLFTGLDPSRHNVYKNKVLAKYVGFPTLLSAAKKAGYSTAMLYAKKKLAYLIRPGSLDYQYGPGRHAISSKDAGARELAAVFSIIWPVTHFNLTFVHIREPDLAGHRYGWMSKAYIAAVGVADVAIGEIIHTLESSELRGKIGVIITADHGGDGNKHWGASNPLYSTIPWIYYDPRSYNPQSGDSVISQRKIDLVDTTVTVAALLGLEMPNNLDGSIIQEVLYPRVTAE